MLQIRPVLSSSAAQSPFPCPSCCSAFCVLPCAPFLTCHYTAHPLCCSLPRSTHRLPMPLVGHASIKALLVMIGYISGSLFLFFSVPQWDDCINTPCTNTSTCVTLKCTETQKFNSTNAHTSKTGI